MAIKELQTRIALKYDSYSAWTTAPGKDLVLLKGELGICHIGDVNQGSNVVPTVLFKVGDGTSTFEALPWASAKAADVYSWAKASDVQLDGKVIKFVGTDKSITLDYLTETEVRDITSTIAADVSGLDNRLKLVEASIGLGATGDGETTGSVAEMLGEFSSTLATITGEGAGSIKKAEADAKAYADQKVSSLSDEFNNTISQLSSTVSGNTAAIAGEKAARESADGVLDNRLTSVENKVNAFFDGAAEDSDGLNNALDKLVDIQNYLNGEGEGANDLLTQVSKNTSDITELTKTVTDNATSTSASLAGLTGTVDTATAKITELQNIVNDESKGNEQLRTDVNALQGLTGDNAKGNDALYNSLQALTETVMDSTSGLSATYAIASKNKEDIATLNSAVAGINNREANYVNYSDKFIFNCGSADENTFVENNQ